MNEEPSSVRALAAQELALSLVAVAGPQIPVILLQTIRMTRMTAVGATEVKEAVKRDQKAKVTEAHRVEDRVVSLAWLPARPQQVLAVPQVHNQG